ncbi:PLP-dependent aminotransferase family protein [Cognatishimia activa]|uniref:aminotransferase-like domain-containing protein n=1 Tax=Cognatishimia activa TaxID=1715691 RepID=UPI002231B013|nr:PLP-dependent aminotransferase family protein [Cognatishimia activa]UZD90475.1 PLP-dependent aminotransferase family protein [Cognatishimia activa]
MDFESVFASRTSRMKASEIRELLKLLDRPGLISFAGGIPDASYFPAKQFGAAYQEALTAETAGTALQYSISEGYTPLRRWLAKEMAKLGVTCTEDNIMITSGSQQALDYLGKMLLSPGDTALINWPTYLGALGAFNAYEPRYDKLTVNGNRSAADISAAAQAEGGRVKFAYLSADFANPTGETVDRRGRENLIDMAEELECVIIEDAAYQSLRYDGEVVPPILALEIERKGSIEECRTIYCGSFSKTLSPGLRIGWICAAQPLVSQMVLLKQAGDLHVSTVNQMAISKVAETHFDTHVSTLHKVYSERRDAMLQALEEMMPKGVQWTKPEGGMFVWLTLPAHIDASELFKVALETENVAFVPGHAFFADGSGKNTMRLSFSCADAETIREGVRRLSKVVQEAL